MIGQAEMPADPAHDLSRGSWITLAVKLALRAAARPALARDLVCLVWAFRRHGWYRTPPFLPVPPREYVGWRMYTAYGSPNAVPSVDDVVRFATWRRRILRL